MKKRKEATIPSKRNKGGRPKKYTDVELFEQKIEAYFDYCDKNYKPYTMTGLANSLGIDRTTLINYSKDDKLFNSVKKAKSRVEQYAEEQLYGSKQTTGIIFNLKNNFGWVDKQEINADVKQEATISIALED